MAEYQISAREGFTIKKQMKFSESGIKTGMFLLAKAGSYNSVSFLFFVTLQAIISF